MSYRAKIIPSYYQSFKDAGIQEYTAFDSVGFDIDENRMTITGTLSSISKDREGEVILCDKIDTTNHKRNPIVLWEHGKQSNEWGLPIAQNENRDTGEYTVWTSPESIIQQAWFSQKSKVAEQLFALAAEKTIRGWSMGFRRMAAKRLPPDLENGHPTGLLTYRGELLETSLVCLPCNPEALTSIVDRGLLQGKSLDPALKSFLMPFCLPKKEWANGVNMGMATKGENRFQRRPVINDHERDALESYQSWQRRPSTQVQEDLEREARNHDGPQMGGSPRPKGPAPHDPRKPLIGNDGSAFNHPESIRGSVGYYNEVQQGPNDSNARQTWRQDTDRVEYAPSQNNYEGTEKVVDPSVQSRKPQASVRHERDIEDPEVREQYGKGRERAYERRDRQSSDERYHGEGYEEKSDDWRWEEVLETPKPPKPRPNDDHYDKKEVSAESSGDQTAGGALVGNRKKTRVTNATRRDITRETVGAFQPREGKEPKYHPTEPYESALKKPLHQRLAHIRENDEQAISMGRPTYSDQVLHGVAGWHDTQGSLRDHTTEVTANERATEETARQAHLERQRSALPNTLRDASEQVRRRTGEIFQGLHNDNRGSLSHDEFVAAHDAGHFARRTPEEVEQTRESRRRPEGWTQYPGGSDNGKRADQKERDMDETKDYDSGDTSDMRREDVEQLQSSGEHTRHGSEEAIEDRDPDYQGRDPKRRRVVMPGEEENTVAGPESGMEYGDMDEFWKHRQEERRKRGMSYDFEQPEKSMTDDDSTRNDYEQGDNRNQTARQRSDAAARQDPNHPSHASGYAYNEMPQHEMDRLVSSGEHSEHPDEEAIAERRGPHRYQTVQAPNAGRDQIDVPTQEEGKSMEDDMKDMPGAAALRKLHGHFSALQGLCGAMKDVEQPKVRALLEKLSGHAAGHMEGIGELFGGIYGDHKPLCATKDGEGEVREGAPGEDDSYEAKDAKGEEGISQSDIEDYDRNPQTRDSRHPEGWQVADGGAREHGGRWKQNTRDSRNPEGWQQAHGGPDNGNESERLYEIRNPNGKFRRPAALDEKSYKQEVDRLKREIKRKAEILGVA